MALQIEKENLAVFEESLIFPDAYRHEIKPPPSQTSYIGVERKNMSLDP